MRTLILILVVALAAGCSRSAVVPYATCRSDTPAPEDPTATLNALEPELMVTNVDVGVAYYRDELGFTVLRNDAADHSCFAEVALGPARMLLNHIGASSDPPGHSLELRFIIDDVDGLNTRAKDRGLDIVRPLRDTDYGLREFVVRDPYGFLLRFARPTP